MEVAGPLGQRKSCESRPSPAPAPGAPVQIEAANKARDEVIKQLRKLQVSATSHQGVMMGSSGPAETTEHDMARDAGEKALGSIQPSSCWRAQCCHVTAAGHRAAVILSCRLGP